MVTPHILLTRPHQTFDFPKFRWEFEGRDLTQMLTLK
jgi:hypothetical protein